MTSYLFKLIRESRRKNILNKLIENEIIKKIFNNIERGKWVCMAGFEVMKTEESCRPMWVRHLTRTEGELCITLIVP